MKKLILQTRVLGVAGALMVVPVASTFCAESDSAAVTNTPAKSSVAAPESAVSSQTTDSAGAKLPQSVGEVVKLSRAKVSEDVVLSYVQNSGAVYSLSADDIVRLRNEGVSDRVINAMLDQHAKAVETAQKAAAPAATSADDSASGATAPASESATSAPPPVVEAPMTPPGSSVYFPYPATAYYAYPPDYYGPWYYGCYGGPIVSFRFGFWGGHGGHGHLHGGR